MCYSSSPDIQLLQLAFLAAIYFPLPNIVLTRLLPSIFEVKGPEEETLHPNLCSASRAAGFVPCLADHTTKQGHNSQSPSPITWMRQLSFCFSQT